MQEKIQLKKCEKALDVFCDVCSKELIKNEEYYNFTWKKLTRDCCKWCKQKVEANALRTRTRQVDYFRKTI